MPQSLTSICAGGASLAAIDYSDDTPHASRTTDLIGRPYGFALDEGCAAAYACHMLCRFHSVSSSVQSAQSVATYSYLEDSDPLSGGAYPHARGEGSLTITIPELDDIRLVWIGNRGRPTPFATARKPST